MRTVVLSLAERQMLRRSAVGLRQTRKADPAGGGDIHAAEDLQEGGLARAVLADQSMHFAGPNPELDVVERANTRKLHRDVLDLEERGLSQSIDVRCGHARDRA